MEQKQQLWEENMLPTVCDALCSPVRPWGGWACTASHISALQISGTMLLYVCRWGLVLFSMLIPVRLRERMQSCVQLCTQCSGRRCFQCQAQVFSCRRWHIGRDGVLASCPDCEQHQRAARLQVPQVYWQLRKGNRKMERHTHSFTTLCKMTTAHKWDAMIYCQRPNRKT